MNYKYIWAWEILKGTTSADIVRGIVSLAREENAPPGLSCGCMMAAG